MPATTIDEVIKRLDEIVNTARERNDRTGYFAALYKKVTIAVAEKIQQSGFEDNSRMERLDVVFANRYLTAFDQYKNGQPCSASWQLAFDAAKGRKHMVIDHLLAGMNAHIGLDLGIAAATVAPGSQVNGLQNDFNQINEVLNGLVEEVKADLFAMWPLSKYITKLNTGKIENALAGFSMVTAREAAWKTALAYAPLTTDAERQTYIAERDAKVAAFGNKILYPGFLLRSLRFIFRLFEFGGVAGKIKRLDD